MTIVVLGGGIDLQGRIPPFVQARLKRAAEIFKKEKNTKILCCGKYSFLYPKKISPPKTEARAMADYLSKFKIPQEAIFLEEKSKDTIGNAYYAKKNYFIPKKEKKAIVITSDFHMSRAKFIFYKIFGKLYQLRFVATPSYLSSREKRRIFQRQKELLCETKKILARMKKGNHNFLKGKLYKIKFYKEQRPDWVKKFVTKGET